MESVPDLELLRQRVIRLLERQRDVIVQDTTAVLPFAGMDTLEPPDGARLSDLGLQVLLEGVRRDPVDPRADAVAALRVFAMERKLAIRALFDLVYVLERTALDEAALDDTLGATSDEWPAVAQVVRHASFGALAALTERVAQETTSSTVDALTTVHSRGVFRVALEKETRRSERSGHPFALVLVNVDRLAALNADLGYGFGDRVLERLGIVLRSYFREHDWVAREAEDTFAVVLPETAPEHARVLAEQVRAMVAERLSLHDHRSDREVPVTVSVAVLSAEVVDASVTADVIVEQARQALVRAKQGGRNRVEAVVLKAARDPGRQDYLHRRGAP